MSDFESLEKDIQSLRERNIRVEAEKAWEISTFRKISVSAVTYIIAGIVLSLIHANHPWRNALIPTVGYFLSTLSLPFLKRRWIEKYLKKKGRIGIN